MDILSVGGHLQYCAKNYKLADESSREIDCLTFVDSHQQTQQQVASAGIQAISLPV